MASQAKTFLTEVARPIAEQLAIGGSIKKTISAGIMALNDLTLEEQKYYYALAEGIPPEQIQNAEDVFQQKVLRVLETAQKIPAKKKLARKANPSKVG